MRDVVDVRQGAGNKNVTLAGNRKFNRCPVVGRGGGEIAHRRFN